MSILCVEESPLAVNRGTVDNDRLVTDHSTDDLTEEEKAVVCHTLTLHSYYCLFCFSSPRRMR